MYDQHFGRKSGKEQPLVQGAVAATYYYDGSVAVERAVTGGAIGYPSPRQFPLARNPKPTVFGASGNDDGLCTIGSLVCGDKERILAQLYFGYVLVGDDRIKSLSMSLHLLGQCEAADAIGKAGEVLHCAGACGLTSQRRAREQHRIQRSPGAVQCCGQPGGTCPNDDEVLIDRYLLGRRRGLQIDG